MFVFFRSILISSFFIFFFFNDTATTEIYTLSLHDALPICFSFQTKSLNSSGSSTSWRKRLRASRPQEPMLKRTDRKSTRLNSSHGYISYAVFCLKKKKKTKRYVNIATNRTTNSRSLQRQIT